MATPSVSFVFLKAVNVQVEIWIQTPLCLNAENRVNILSRM